MTDHSTSLGQNEQKLCHQPFLTGYEEQSAEMSQMTGVDAVVHMQPTVKLDMQWLGC